MTIYIYRFRKQLSTAAASSSVKLFHLENQKTFAGCRFIYALTLQITCRRHVIYACVRACLFVWRWEDPLSWDRQCMCVCLYRSAPCVYCWKTNQRRTSSSVHAIRYYTCVYSSERQCAVGERVSQTMRPSELGVVELSRCASVDNDNAPVRIRANHTDNMLFIPYIYLYCIR